MLPGVYGQDKGGFPLDGIAVGEPLAVNLVGNRCVRTCVYVGGSCGSCVFTSPHEP